MNEPTNGTDRAASDIERRTQLEDELEQIGRALLIDERVDGGLTGIDPPMVLSEDLIWRGCELRKLPLHDPADAWKAVQELNEPYRKACRGRLAESLGFDPGPRPPERADFYLSRAQVKATLGLLAQAYFLIAETNGELDHPGTDADSYERAGPLLEKLVEHYKWAASFLEVPGDPLTVASYEPAPGESEDAPTLQVVG